jgi:ABC-type cobalt transport system substrate-binding protein
MMMLMMIMMMMLIMIIMMIHNNDDDYDNLIDTNNYITNRIDDGIDWLHALLKDINIPSLSQLCQGK